MFRSVTNNLFKPRGLVEVLFPWEWWRTETIPSSGENFSGRGDFPFGVNMGSDSIPSKTLSDESTNRSLVCAHMHSVAQTKKSWRSYPRQVNAGNKNTPSTHHPLRRNVTTSMVGLRNRSHMQKSHPKWWSPEIWLGKVEEESRGAGGEAPVSSCPVMQHFADLCFTDDCKASTLGSLRQPSLLWSSSSEFSPGSFPPSSAKRFSQWSKVKINAI